MKQVKFLKEPGYMYDLFFLFVLYFNEEKCLTYLRNNTKADNVYFGKLLSEFAPFSDELLPFFYLKDNAKCFMTQFYFDPYKARFTTTYTLSAIQEALSNYDKVIENVVRFFFENVTEEIILECKHSPVAVGRLIRRSDYNSDLKSSLYAFFLEPVPVIQKLIYELMAKEFMLSRLYGKMQNNLMELQHDFDLERLESELNQCKNQIANFSSYEVVFVSFCICINFCIKALYCGKDLVMLLGCQYTEFLKKIIDQQNRLVLDTFGNALAESHRIDILDFILNRGEVTIRDIEQELGFSGTNAYYHLSLMIKANILQTKNQGRTVLYSINKQSFDAACDLLSRYSTKTKGESL